MKRSFIWCFDLDTLENRSEIFWKFSMWCFARMEKISWTARVKQDTLRRVKDERNTLHWINNGTLSRLVTSCVGTAFNNTLLKVRYRRREDVEEDVGATGWPLRNAKILGIGRESTRSHSVQNLGTTYGPVVRVGMTLFTPNNNNSDLILLLFHWFFAEFRWGI